MRSGLALLALWLAVPVLAQSDEAPVAGVYSGSQSEMAVMLELTANGNYRYQLSYGALDEWSAGGWTRQGDAVLLKSDPFKPPLFTVASQANQSGTLSVRLDLPDGIDPQFFAITLHRRDGSASFEAMQDGGVELAMGDNPVVSVRPVLPIMNLSGPAVEIPATGAAMQVVFAPNDLGFVGFDQERLVRDDGAFVLERHGRSIRFEKQR